MKKKVNYLWEANEEVFRTAVLTISDEPSERFANYTEQMIPFCPFLSEAINRGLCSVSTVCIKAGDPVDLEILLFFYFIQRVTEFKSRRQNIELEDRMYYCNNVVIEDSTKALGDVTRPVPWAHWMLKVMYTEQHIIFGDFWRGEMALSSRGICIPSPPFNFISIRSLHQRDRRFFRETPSVISARISDSEAKRAAAELVVNSGTNLIADTHAAGRVYFDVRAWSKKVLDGALAV
jgi:hypothetical protein